MASENSIVPLWPPLLLKSLYVQHFKNYEALQLQFTENVVGITGKNGIGKTNLLDAIHYLCMTRSAFHTNEQYSIQHGHQHFVLHGEFERNGEVFPTGCQFEKGKRKLMKMGKVAYEKVSDHIGQFPCVMLSPDDAALIREGSEVRRKFFDGLICQTDAVYLQHLLRYNQALRQRNYLLKQFADRPLDADLLEPYTQILLQLAEQIAVTRQTFTKAIVPIFEDLYQKISGSQEAMEIRYTTKVDADFETTFRQALPQDRILQRTTQGIHQDRYAFYMEGNLLKRFGSQGQQKSFLIALNLAKAHLIAEQTQRPPILLLDDIFDKLDEERIARLLSVLAHESDSQIFLTDARPERSEQLLRVVGKPFQLLHLPL